MKKSIEWVHLFTLSVFFLGIVPGISAGAQTLPGDKVVFGPMFSPVYDNSVRVWVLTESTGSGETIHLEVKSSDPFSSALPGEVYQADDRLGYTLRSYLYTGLKPGETYTAIIDVNGQATDRAATIVNENAIVDDFSFLSGGCGRIYDLSRCIDQPESQTHKNGDPEIFNRMAGEDSDLMIWLGDATYLLGLQHADGQCPDAIDDWANKDTAFARYMFYRQFHDKLLQSMPQLAITDNHDTGPNEFNKTLPSLNEMKEIFREWWPNPEYLSTQEGQGLFSAYPYKDVEYFLFDNRSFRDDTRHHLGPEQFEWLKQRLLASTATFKILINATPSFAKHWGGRNFSVTDQGDELVQFIQDNNIDGVISFSADIHQQEFYGRYGGVKYPLFDVLSGNLNSDVGDGNFSVDYGRDSILSGIKQTYLKVSVYGEVGDRRMKIQYRDLDGNPYFEEIIHQDMLKSVEEETLELGLSFSGTLEDSSDNHFVANGNIAFGADRKGEDAAAAIFDGGSIQVLESASVAFRDRAFSVGFWISPAAFSPSKSVIFSNGGAGAGVTLGLDGDGQLEYTDHASGEIYTSPYSLALNQWSHVVWKYDNVKRQLSLYQNGLLARRWSGVSTASPSGADISLGANFQGGIFRGALDEITLYGKLLSDAFIKQLADYESNRSDVLSLDGAQDMTIPAEEINPALAGDFTIEFWGRLLAHTVTNGKILASNSRVEGNTTGLSFEFPDSGHLNIVAGTNGGGWNAITGAGEPWTLGEWNHVAVSATQNGRLVYFVNGEQVGETDFSGYVPNPTGLGIGDSPYYGSEVRAEMEELRIWNRALSREEIRQNMHVPLSGAEDNLVFYYDFNGQGSDDLVSKGANTYAIALNGATIVDGSAPVVDLPAEYRDEVTANWSIGNDSGAGLYLSDGIAGFHSNVVIGHQRGVDTEPLDSTSNIFYLAPGWWVNPSNLVSGDIGIDLATTLSNPEIVTDIASEYWLLQGEPHGDYSMVGADSAGGNIIRFDNVPLIKSDAWHLVWRDSTLPRFRYFREAEDFSHQRGIRLEDTTDEGDGQNVGWIDRGGWMVYQDVSIPEDGEYTLEFRVASPRDGGKLRLRLSGSHIGAGKVDIPKTGGWQQWRTISQTLPLDAGTYSVRIQAPRGGWNLNWWRITGP